MSQSRRRPAASPPPANPWSIALTALGVVFGDLGTSPLYTLQTVVGAEGGRFTPESALGILSLIIWTLIVTISLKYCLFVMRADNHGEGGILALMSLVTRHFRGRGAKMLTTAGLIGAALLYGDGVITPSISVLSALEGVNVVTDVFRPVVMPLAVAVLVILFAVQRFGTGRIGGAFGPVMLLWFIVIAVLGISGVVRNPIVLTAIDPRHGALFLAHSGYVGLLVLGGVFLCITGGEALYADMGHFGKGPIRLSWYLIVLPALLLSYAGQTGLLIEKGTINGNPFFELAPSWAVYPLVGLATIATIIASQAIITGSFSMTRQAMQLGWFPGVNIRQTSDRVYGQIYVPAINALMMVTTVGITVGFRSSDKLAGAYGTAVSTTMLLTTVLLVAAMLRVWRWSMAIVLPLAVLFLAVDLAFFCANLLKIAEGGWLPLTLAALVFLTMITWHKGVRLMRGKLPLSSEPSEKFLADIKSGKVIRVPGTSVFFSAPSHLIPPFLIDHVAHTGSLREAVIILTVKFEETPRVEHARRCDVEALGKGLWRLTMRFGFIEIPDIASALERLNIARRSVDFSDANFFASRDLIVTKPDSPILAKWRAAIFSFLYRNSVRTIDRFSLPADHVVEVGRQIEI